jgi:uncharacterized membrane protein
MRNRTETLTLVVTGTYLTSMAGSAIVEDDTLQEGPQATASATACPVADMSALVATKRHHHEMARRRHAHPWVSIVH